MQCSINISKDFLSKSSPFPDFEILTTAFFAINEQGKAVKLKHHKAISLFWEAFEKIQLHFGRSKLWNDYKILLLSVHFF